MRRLGRRQFLTAAGGGCFALVAACSPGVPTQPGSPRKYRLAEFVPGGLLSSNLQDAFVGGLHDVGYRDGEKLLTTQHTVAGASDDQMGPAITQMVQSLPEVIVVPSQGDARLVLAATDIPIVSFGAGNLVDGILATSHAHPGGTVTGLSTPSAMPARILQAFKEAVPSLRRVTVIQDVATGSDQREPMTPAALGLGLSIVWAEIRAVTDIEPAFKAITEQGADGVYLSGGRNISAGQARIAELALTNNLPSGWQQSEAVNVGGLMGYGPNRLDLHRRAAGYVDKIFKGALPGDLPIEEPTLFDLQLNLQTATRLCITIPPAVLAQATEIIR